MLNKHQLYSDVLKTIINHQYRLDYPLVSTGKPTNSAIRHYTINTSFRAKVDGLAKGVMSTLGKHLQGINDAEIKR